MRHPERNTNEHNERHRTVYDLPTINTQTTDALRAERTANAHLIAAAPELLDALNGAQQWMRHTTVCERTIERTIQGGKWECTCGLLAMHHQVIAAIAKAQGRS